MKRSAVDSCFVNKVQGNPRAFFRRSDFTLERYRLGRSHLGNLHHTHGASVIIVKVGHEPPGIKNSKCAGQRDTAIVQGRRPQRAHDNSRIRYSMEFLSRSRWEPVRLEAATFARTQSAHGAVEFGFEIVRA